MKPVFKEGRYGYAFKDGKLYWFDKRHVLVMTSWPDPRAWFKRRSHDWKATRKWADELLSPCLFPRSAKAEVTEQPIRQEPEVLPSGQYLLPNVFDPRNSRYEEIERRNRSVLGTYFDTIPDDVRDELLKYPRRKWHVFNILARCPGAFDLSRGNPALFYALASNWVFHKPPVLRPVRAARSLVYKKQKHILEWLGFPGTEPSRRILAKIVPGSLSVEALLYLRSSFSDPFVVKCLSHLDRINAGVLRLATDRKYRNLITARLLEDISRDVLQDQPNPPVFSILIDTLKMVRMVDWKHCPHRFVTLARLKEVHDELSRRLRPEVLMEKYNLPSRFPDPPFAGTEVIRPIMTPDDLCLEGYEMNHCVAAHAVGVAEGEEFVYRVMSPVRATLSIRRSNGRWISDQIFKAYNELVPETLSERVFDELFHSARTQHGPAADEEHDSAGGDDPRQLPLLAPEQLQVYLRCVRAFQSN